MRITNISLLAAGMLLCLALPAQAELSITEEAGVTVTRGVVQSVQHKSDTHLHGADFTLPRDFRGAVFGKPLLFIEGQYQRRDRIGYSRWCCGRR